MSSCILLNIIGLLINCVVENGSTQPLLLNTEAKQQQESDDQELDDDDDEDSEITHKPVSSIVSAYRLLTPSVKV